MQVAGELPLAVKGYDITGKDKTVGNRGGPR